MVKQGTTLKWAVIGVITENAALNMYVQLLGIVVRNTMPDNIF